jgi:sn-glycerol 3-phosphate transport system permease protein
LSDARTTTTTVLDRTAVGARPRPTVTVHQAEAERPRRRTDWNAILVHAALIVAVALVAFPLYYAFVISTQAMEEVIQKPPRLAPSSFALENYVEAWRRSGMARLLLNSAIVAVVVAVGKIAISMLSAFAIVYFRFRGATLVFWLIFLTLMLPIPVRILSTYEVVGNIGWLNTYAGLTVPLMASATATFLFRQFYLTIPNELAEAAQLDGAGPLRFLWSFLLPLSWANVAALFVVLFIYGWNEYFWPLLITNTEEMRTVVIGLERLIPRSGTELPTWNLIMAGAMMALIPPVAVILFMQRWFVKGLIESDK